MSTTIDERVVSMQFDNSHFESNVQTSLSTLDKLKQSLNLTGASKGLENINAAAKDCDLSVMGRGVETVQTKFSALQVMAATALANITNSAVNAGKRIATALTFEPIKTGFQEYETQIGAVQTILANTQGKGATLQDVNKALDELNTYADKTIYNFTEMTKNIGTFTAAGVDLDKSVTSIKGIANLAAVSGSTSQQASTAMYQLSQALAAGKVSLMDWNSVVNAGMGGQVFQDALKRTATQMGTNVDALIKKYGSFRESLTKGEWLTAEVLTETLTQLSGAYSEADLIAQGYSKKQAKQITELADTAVGAATEVKTFTQLFDTLKESVQSGWTQTWEILIGDFGEAKSLLTEISNAIGEVVGASNDSRNALLSGTFSTGWKQILNQGIDDAVGFEETVTKVAKKHGVDLSKMIDDETTFQDTLKDGWMTGDILSESVSTFAKELGGMSAKEREAAGYTEETIKKLQELDKKFKEGTLTAQEYADLMARPSGRELLIESVWNVMKAIQSVITPVKEAFSEIFDGLDSYELYNVINALKSFTASLALNGDQAKKLKATFKGVFSAFDIVLTVVKEVAGGFFDLLGNFTGLGGGILGITASLGNWITKLRDVIKNTDIFGIGIGKIVGAIQNVIDKIKEFTSATKEKIELHGFDALLAVLGGVAKVLTSVGGKIIEVAGSIGDAIIAAFKGGDIKSGLDILNGVIFMDILKNIKKFIKGISGVLDTASGTLGSMGDTLKALQGILESYQKNLKAQTLMKIAIAIGILAASLLVISMINPDKLTTSLGAVTVLFADLMASFAVFGKTATGLKAAHASANVMKSIAVAVLILAFALKQVADVEPDKMTGGIIGIGALTAIVVKSAQSMSGIKGKVVKGATGLVIFAAAIKVLASAVKDLSTLEWDELAKGLAGVGGLMAAVSLFLNNTNMKGKSAGAAVGILILSAAIKVLASACKDFSTMEWTEIGKGLIAIGALLTELAVFTKLTGNAKNVVSTGAALVLIAASMKIFASAMKDFSGMSWDEIGRGLSAMAGALIAVTIAVNFMPKNIVGIGVGLVIVASALTILSNALNTMGGMTWEEIGKGLITLAVSMGILAGGLYAMNGSLAGSAALIIAAGAITVLANALNVMGGMSWVEVGKSLLTMAGALTILGVAGLLLAPVIPALLGIAGAVALLGVGCLAAGVGIGAFATGLAALATSGIASITLIVTGIIGLIPAAMVAIGKGIIDLVSTLTKGISAFEKLLTALAELFISTFVKVIPDLCEAIVQLISSLLKTIADHLPEVLASAISIIMTLLKGIRDNIADIIEVGVDIILNLLSGIASQIPKLIDSAFEIIISFINGLADAIDKNTPLLISATKRLFLALLRSAILVLTGGVVDIKAIGKKIMESGFIKGVKEKISNAVKTVKEIPKKCVEAIKEKVSSFKSVGADVITGFVNGIKNGFSKVTEAGKSIGKKALEAAKKALDSHSPSKEFEQLGEDSDTGMINGLKNFAGKVAKAASDVGNKALDTMKRTISGISDIFNSDVDSQPTIRPVLDLSEITTGAKAIDGLFGMQPSVGVLANVGAISSSMNRNQNGSNDDVVSAIKELGKSIGDMSGDTYNVGGITYDDGSNITNAVQTLVRAAKIQRRV